MRTLAQVGGGAAMSSDHLRRSAQRLESMAWLDSRAPLVQAVAHALTDKADPWTATVTRIWRWLPTRYVPERRGDRWQRAPTTLRTGIGDCEDWSVLLASTLKASGIEARVMTLPLHVAIAVPVTRANGAFVERAGWDVHPHAGQTWIFLESTLPPAVRATQAPGSIVGHITSWANTPYLQIATMAR